MAALTPSEARKMLRWLDDPSCELWAWLQRETWAYERDIGASPRERAQEGR